MYILLSHYLLYYAYDSNRTFKQKGVNIIELNVKYLEYLQ